MSCDMLIHGINVVHNSGHPQHECINAAQITARCRLLRVSEVLKVAKEDHFLRACDVEFEFTNGSKIWCVPAFEVNEVLRPNLSGVSIYTRSRKNDISVGGQKGYFKHDCVSNQGFNLSSTLFNWAIKAQLQSDDQFFSYRQCWRLTYSVFNESHKKIARSLGIDPTNFSTHSSRIGGACTLACAGFPDSFIMLYGGWSSLAFLYYIRLSVSQYTQGLNALSNPNIFTMVDVRKMVSGYKTSQYSSLRK